MRFFEFKDIKKTPLVEAEARIQHAEDLIFWQGSKGAARALNSLKSLEKGAHKDVTIKWDGSPAVIFGRNEDGEFIFTDKSGFGAKGYDGRSKSPEALEKMFLGRGGGAPKSDSYKEFAANMRDVFTVFEGAVPNSFRGYFKGDLLYFRTPPIKDGEYIFKPQLVTYHVPVKSELGQRIANSIAGVVIHRIVEEDGTERPLENFNIFDGNDLMVMPPVTVEKAPNVSNSDVAEVQKLITQNSSAIDKMLNQDTLTSMKMKKFPEVLYTYTNSKVSSLDNLGDDFESWLATSKLSEPMKNKISEYIVQNAQGFTAMWKIAKGIIKIKNDVIADLDKNGNQVKASINGQAGGEGYVLAHSSGDIKLVNRGEFTAANRAVERT
jgi:hypothetical protein